MVAEFRSPGPPTSPDAIQDSNSTIEADLVHGFSRRILSLFHRPAAGSAIRPMSLLELHLDAHPVTQKREIVTMATLDGRNIEHDHP